MAKAGKQGSQKQGGNASSSTTPKATDVNKSGARIQAQTTAAQTPSASQSTLHKSRSGNRNNRLRIGGTAVPGAKSTLPREATPSSNSQQAESYNRTMRRRMEQLGTGPGQQSSPADQQRKRLEKRRRRTEERRQEVKRVAARGPRSIKLGRTVIFFLIGVIVLIILIIIIAVLINRFR